LIETLVLILTAIGTVGTIAAAVFAYRTLKCTPKPPEPKTFYGSPTIYGVKMPEPPGLPGYDVKRRKGPLHR